MCCYVVPIVLCKIITLPNEDKNLQYFSQNIYLIESGLGT